MISPQRLPASLTPLDVALAALLRRPRAGRARRTSADRRAGLHRRRYAAAQTRIRRMISPPPTAGRCAPAISSARPPIRHCRWPTSPVWVEAGDPMPEGCDCVIDSDSVDQTGPMLQVLAEAIPGQGVRRTGGDIAAGSRSRRGRAARAAARSPDRARGGLRKTERAPAAPAHRQYSRRRRGGDGAVDRGERAQGRRRCRLRRGRGARCSIHCAATRCRRCDLLLTVGGSGVGRTDATVTALAQRGEVIAHGIALQPGRTTAVGRIGKTPVIALQGAPDQAFAAWWTLALPVLDRLSGRRPRKTLNLPLARKIASGVGIAEIVLLRAKAGRLGDAGGRRPLARCHRPRRSLARGAWRRAKVLLRARRSMAICCGNDMEFRHDQCARSRKTATPSIRTSS